MRSISVIIPCYNEEGNIKPFFDEIKKIFSKEYNFELIFINDGSYDQTLLEMKKLINTNLCKIKILDFSRNFGKEAAIYAGLENCSGDYAVMIDVDLQQDPQLILKMLKTVNEKKCDGVSFYQKRRKENFIISFCKKIFYKIFNKVIGINIIENASDFRLINRKMIDTILSFKEVNRFSKGIFPYIGFDVVYLPYSVNKRKIGKSKYNFKKLYNYAIDGIIAFANLPLLLCKLFRKVIILTISILIILGLVNNNLSSYNLFIFILIISYFNVLILSIFSKYIDKTYNEVKKRPIYITKDIYENNQ